jgi:ArsR family transcriptional regulator
LIYNADMAVQLDVPTARAAALFHALSDEKRLRILSLLRAGERCVCELTDALDLPQSLLSFHLKTLREAGLVADRREGRWVYYAIATGAIGEALVALEELNVEPPVRARAARC